ncbi:MAG: molecular chaperone HtpG [Christensenellales bacterium]
MAKKQFKTESKRILDLMIHSIYTNKEIFLRELISNASDAIDKLYFRSLTDSAVGLNREDFFIKISLDKEARTLSIEDNGCGMTKDELENNLGVIARSGTLDFKNESDLGAQDDIEIIGQFGVGFYSAFMVSAVVQVVSRAFGEEQAHVWESEGPDGYTIRACDKDTHGTLITLTLKENEKEENYDEFLETHRITGIVKKYSDYIRYPIRMELQKSRLKEGSEEEYKSYTEEETLNSMVPLWRRNKSELTREEYDQFYKDKFYDYEDPLSVIHVKAEGAVSYQALLYLPAKAPYNYYTRDYEKGLQLYANGVLIMDKCADLLSDHFSFIKGLADSQDLSLNISREMLQQDRQLAAIAKNLSKKIKAELERLLKNERETYEKFFGEFGMQLKYGLYSGFGAHKEDLKDLVLYYSMAQKKLVTLQEYTDAMPQDQKYIYYACGETAAKIELLPQTERVREKGYDILCLTDDVDEFAIQMLREYAKKEFRSVSGDDIGIEDEQQQKDVQEKTEANKELLDFMKEALSGKVHSVQLSGRLSRHPICLSTQGVLSIEMEKVLNAMPAQEKAQAQRVLEINAEHPVFEKLRKLYEQDQEMLKTYSALLYAQAQLIEGLPIEDPVAFSNEVSALMAKE